VGLFLFRPNKYHQKYHRPGGSWIPPAKKPGLARLGVVVVAGTGTIHDQCIMVVLAGSKILFNLHPQRIELYHPFGDLRPPRQGGGNPPNSRVLSQVSSPDRVIWTGLRARPTQSQRKASTARNQGFLKPASVTITARADSGRQDLREVLQKVFLDLAVSVLGLRVTLLIQGSSLAAHGQRCAQHMLMLAFSVI
jgi:hypothetical protein